MKKSSVSNIQDFFPSTDGALDKREHFFGLLSELLTNFDNLKDPNCVHLAGYKNREGDFYNRITRESHIPAGTTPSENIINELIELVKDSPIQNKHFLANAAPLASIPSILGMLTAFLVNGNVLWDVYGPAGAEAEVRVVSMISKLLGYDADKSGGYSTWGGQGCIFSALRIAITQFAPQSLERGVPQNFYAFASESSHFSLFKSVEATGLGRNKLVKVKSNPDNTMDLRDLRRKMTEVIAKGGIPIFVVATMGTTDTFSMDDLKGVYQVCREVAEINSLKKPYIHADSAMGGFYAFFNDYDLDANPLQFSPAVVRNLRPIQKKMQHLHLADSVTFDFHKLGQAPYASSLFVLKDCTNLNLVDLPSNETPYIGNRGYGSYHTGYTLECSRGANAIGMYACLLAFGKEGYQRLLAQYVEVTQAFREALIKIPGVEVVNTDCPGMITLFRVYPEGAAGYQAELAGTCTKAEIDRVNQLNEHLYERFGQNRREIFLGDTNKFQAVSTCDGHTVSLHASKIFVISPYTEVQHVDEVVAYIEKTIGITRPVRERELVLV